MKTWEGGRVGWKMTGMRRGKVNWGGLGNGGKGDGSYIAWETPTSGEIMCLFMSYQKKKKKIGDKKNDMVLPR